MEHMDRGSDGRAGAEAQIEDQSRECGVLEMRQ